MAVDLFFAQSGAGGAQQENDDVAMLSDDEEEEAESAQGPSKAAPLSTSKHSSKKGKNGYHNHDEQPVRAPIPSTRGTMMNAPYSAQYVTPVAGPADNIFNQRAHLRRHQVDNERIREQLERLDPQPNRRHPPRNQAPEIVDHRSMLQNLFKPPTDISFTGPFEGAKAIATEMGKWLLVNVQDVREFACQTLNRDIWSNEGVKELISTNFVFWQVRHDTVDGQRLINYYKLKGFPAIFILDPRTGELVQTFTMKKQDPVTICDFLTSYLDKFPDYYAHDKFFKGTSDVVDTDAFHLGNVPEFASEPECSKSAMFDEEGMQRAARKRKGGDEEQNGKKAKMEYMDVLNEPTRMLSVVDKDEWLQERSSRGEICRIRMKLPDGRMETIEIPNESKLKALFVFIAGRNLTPKEHMFVLSFPRREFSVDDADRTLSALGFSRNEMVHVELK